ncbi:response regulator [Massilia sp. YIM B02443]|uniref:response regulator n=1 Tax=Massilia sp. YIM B02443 TaxID=3050127 RepID=UPI0025B646B7|nr:response regulator [Massilia sp. YIM B02443]MDN4036635.1 response regulator [Massilia sp. YIM B02443]
MKVLVVDDDVVARMMLMHLIDSCGRHEIIEAEDGAEAWRMLAESVPGQAPDIVFCDLRMPQLSGLELLQRLRAHPPLATLPFVLVSAAADGATRDEAAAAGADGYIVKPFRQDDVRAQFERIFAAPQPEDDVDDVDDQAPAAVATRLGIDAARLRLYYDGLGRQMEAAGLELAAADADTVTARLARLREGCAMLGLGSAVAALEQAGAAQAADRAGVAAALALAIRAVQRQAVRV